MMKVYTFTEGGKGNWLIHFCNYIFSLPYIIRASFKQTLLLCSASSLHEMSLLK